jgi:hypothetical protein
MPPVAGIDMDDNAAVYVAGDAQRVVLERGAPGR